VYLVSYYASSAVRQFVRLIPKMSLTLSVTQASSAYDYSTIDVYVYATELR
jgi:hypothetical protein